MKNIISVLALTIITIQTAVAFSWISLVGIEFEFFEPCSLKNKDCKISGSIFFYEDDNNGQGGTYVYRANAYYLSRHLEDFRVEDLETHMRETLSKAAIDLGISCSHPQDITTGSKYIEKNLVERDVVKFTFSLKCDGELPE